MLKAEAFFVFEDTRFFAVALFGEVIALSLAISDISRANSFGLSLAPRLLLAFTEGRSG